MKNLTIKILILAVFFATLNCGSDYFDVNTPTNVSELDELSMNDLLGPAIFNTVTAQVNAERVFGDYSQYFVVNTGDSRGQSTNSAAWRDIYRKALPNLKAIIDKSIEKNAIHFGAVAKILTAINIALATDSWDNIPFSEASLITQNLSPSFDIQEQIYIEIERLLTEAINELESTDNTQLIPNATNDLIYGGDLSKWLKVAYTFRARYRIHLTEVNGTADLADILSDLSNGFSSNADDFQMIYSEGNLNPWYNRQVLSNISGNSHDKVGDQLVSYMNGTSYPYTTISIDPRLSIYADNTSGNSTVGSDWKGYVSGGGGVSSDGSPGNTNFANGGFYTSEFSPVVILSYAEALFIKAEAEFLLNGGNDISIGTNTNAYNAYIDAITANMDKLGVSSGDRDAYLADTSIVLGETNLMLQHIMKEKYIANFLNLETFVDFRRYDFSANVFKDLQLPADNTSSEFPSQWIVRIQYPTSETGTNAANTSANAQSPITPVWWDR